KRSFLRTSLYDSLIFSEWEKSFFPHNLALVPQTPLRYGENPHQRAIWVGKAAWKVLQGKELSYNNLLDSEAAVTLVSDFNEPVVAIIKHGNPCAVSWGNRELDSLFEQAFHADSRSAFGGIVCTNQPIDKSTAQNMVDIFLEVVIAPHFSPDALSVFSGKKNLRLIEWPKPQLPPFEIRTALSGWLVQQRDQNTSQTEFRLMTPNLAASPDVLKDLNQAWTVCKHSKSNAIVITKHQRTLGLGLGQVSRVGSMEIALKQAGAEIEGALIASDAFFPFRDSMDLLKGLNVGAVVQPGGSQRDWEVIEACNELHIPLFFTGTRHFKH
ncbi:MAG: bifunctional phosphoribosylaminoimidazolecarboxamide formyltransferase/inosine monophosphate cyclohydrolase, partial [Proteobacteria bacterium]|nr:bifunctional phosphoribosylaminoimidazolecarboxamide formyltransferase/inosine monophosphate cyclohydrolase [Pseudomonadota bacterium]